MLSLNISCKALSKGNPPGALTCEEAASMLSRRSGRPEPGLLYPYSPSQQEPLSSSSETQGSWKHSLKGSEHSNPHIVDEGQLKPKKVTRNISPLDKWVRPGQTLEGFKTATSWPRCSQRDYMTIWGQYDVRGNLPIVTFLMTETK